MVSEKILVGSALGIHLRPAGAMCDTAVKFDSHITFTFKNKVVNAKSVISILASGGRGWQSLSENRFVAGGI